MQNAGVKISGKIVSDEKTMNILRRAAGQEAHARMDTLKRKDGLNRPGFPGECFICELRLPAHHFRWKHNTLFLPLTEGCGPALPVSIDCYTSPPT